MGLQLQVGKKYRDRHGDVVEIAHYDPFRLWGDVPHPFVDTTDQTYTPSGKFCGIHDKKDSMDLIEEVVQLDVGKKYRRRDGKVVTVEKYESFGKDDRHPYYVDGCWYSVTGAINLGRRDYDLIEEVTEEGDNMGRVKELLDDVPNIISTTQAIKFDRGKPDLSLVPAALVEAAARALGHGVLKYARHNYRNGFAVSRPAAALLRHVFAYLENEGPDPESGLCHLDHAAACLAMLLANIKDGKATDDRHQRG